MPNHSHSMPSQYVPESDYSPTDDLILNLVPRVTRVELPKCQGRKSLFNLIVVDKSPGLKKPAVTTLCGSSNVNSLEHQAKVNFNATPKHRRPYTTYVLKEIELI